MRGNKFEKSHIHILESDSLIIPKRLLIQFHTYAQYRPNIIYFKTYFPDLEGKFTRIGDFTWRVVNMNLLLKNEQTNRQH